MGHKFDAAHWERLLSGERRALLEPGAFIRRLAIPSGAVVADLGAGPGFFTDALADAVGPSGQVHALDVSPDMIEVLRRRDLPPQVTARLSEENRTPLPDASVDLALLAFVLHELDAPLAFLTEARRVLRPGGRLVVLEWVPQVEAMAHRSTNDCRSTSRGTRFGEQASPCSRRGSPTPRTTFSSSAGSERARLPVLRHGPLDAGGSRT